MIKDESKKILNEWLRETYEMVEQKGISYDDAFIKIGKKKYGKIWIHVAQAIGLYNAEVLKQMIKKLEK